jgi:hypothetical protein
VCDLDSRAAAAEDHAAPLEWAAREIGALQQQESNSKVAQNIKLAAQQCRNAEPDNLCSVFWPVRTIGQMVEMSPLQT